MSATKPVTYEDPPLASPSEGALSSKAKPDMMRDVSALANVKQLGLFASIASLSYVFWIVGAMEMVERLAYYGVAAVRMLYGTAPVSAGGLGVTHDQFGTIIAVWALFQSVVPAFTGGLSDRYGYKETIFASTVVKLSGYLVMAFFSTYWGFFAGAILLATGTAIFKPGIQGTLVKSTKRENSSMAWGIFYQTVNIGGFLGPVVAGHMRQMAWRNVFFACAAIICLNFLLLLTYKEPGKAERLEKAQKDAEAKVERKSLAREALTEISKPHVFLFLVLFAGFWFMFYSLFDVLPSHIQDWVDTRSLVSFLFGGHRPGGLLGQLIVMNKAGTEILPEGVVNIDAALIMTTCFLFAALSGKMRPTTSMVIGTLLAASGLIFAGYSVLGWATALAIMIFAVGEMLSSPKFGEFIGNIAPSDKKAMYLGFSQVPVALGSALEGKIGPRLYGSLASKEHFSRQMLLDKGFSANDVAAIPEGEAFGKLVDFLHQDRWEVTRELYRLHHGSVAMVWYIMATVGIVSAIGLYLYGRWIGRLSAAKR